MAVTTSFARLSWKEVSSLLEGWTHLIRVELPDLQFDAMIVAPSHEGRLEFSTVTSEGKIPIVIEGLENADFERDTSPSDQTWEDVLTSFRPSASVRVDAMPPVSVRGSITLRKYK